MERDSQVNLETWKEEEGTDKALELEKYLSLITTLKGFEEFSLNENGIIISTNLEAVNVSGYEEFEIIGMHIDLFYQHQEKGDAHRDLERARTLGQITTTGLRLKKRGGTFWAKMKIKYSTEKQGRVFYKVTLQDATHHALSTLRVQSIRDQYLTIFNNPFVGAFKFKISNYRMLMCNKKTLSITNHETSDNLYFNNLFASSEQFETFITLLKSKKRLEGFQFLIQDNRQSMENWGLISARYFERQEFVEGVLLDISEQYNQMIELKQVNAKLDSFTYHASHDLRAPLTTILGLINLGVTEKSLEAARTYFEMIRSRVTHLDVLLKDLIAVSHNNKAEIETEQFDFRKEVDQILQLIEHPEKKFQLDIVVKQDRPFGTDSVRIRAVLRNLLSNAFKYYNPAVEQPFVGLKIEVYETHASVDLKDNGIGIEPEQKSKIYDMFYRGTTRSTGTGLGLYIVKSIIEKLGGKISTESTINKGTTFLITIPNQLVRENSIH